MEPQSNLVNGDISETRKIILSKIDRVCEEGE